MVVYEPYPGQTINDAAQEAISMAWQMEREVEFVFNGILCVVTGFSKPEQVSRDYMAAMDRLAKEYRESPEGKAAQAKRDAEIAAKQQQVDDLIIKLPFVDLRHALEWIIQYVPLADDVGVNGKSAAVLAALGYLGITQNDSTGLPKESYDDPTIMARYVLGQVVDAYANGSPVHPGLIVKFAQQALDGFAKQKENNR